MLSLSLRRRSLLDSTRLSRKDTDTLTTDAKAYVDEMLAGTAGERLKANLTLILRLKRIVQNRRRLTLMSQPGAVKGEMPRALVLQLLRSIPSLWMLQQVPDDLLLRIEPLLTAKSFRSGEVLMYPREASETAGVLFVFRGGVSVRSTDTVPLVRFADESTSLEASAAKSLRRVPATEDIAAPCIYGANEAASAKFHQNRIVCALSTSSSNVVDTAWLPGHVFRRFLIEVAQLGLEIATPKKKLDADFFDDEDEKKKSASGQNIAAARLASQDLITQIKQLRVGTLQAQFPLTPELIRLSWLFQTVDNVAAHAIIDAAKPESFPAGVEVVKRSSLRRKWYFLRRGALVCEPCDASREPFEILPGVSFGEFSVIYGEKYEYTMRTKASSDLWAIDAKDLAVVLSQDDSLRQHLQKRVSLLRTRMMESDRTALHSLVLATPYATADSPPELVEMLVKTLRPVVVPQRTILASSSTVCDRMFIIVKGALRALRTDYHASFGPGGVIGAGVAITHRWPYPVVTATIVDAWEISRSELLGVAKRMDYIVALQEHLHDPVILEQEISKVIGKEWSGGPAKVRRAVITPPLGFDSFVSAFFEYARRTVVDLAIAFPNAAGLQRLLRAGEGAPRHVKKEVCAPRDAKKRHDQSTHRDIDSRSPLVISLREPSRAVDTNFIQQLRAQQVRLYRPAPAASSPKEGTTGLGATSSGVFDDSLDEWERPRSERSSTSVSRHSTMSGGLNRGADTIVAPEGFFQWEDDVKSLFAMDSVPNLMVLHHNPRLRSEKNKKRDQQQGDSRDANRLKGGSADPYCREAPSDKDLHLCVAPKIPDICLGLSAHRAVRAALALNPSTRSLRYSFRTPETIQQAVPGLPSPGDGKQVGTERSRLLLQLFRSGAFSPKKERQRKALLQATGEAPAVASASPLNTPSMEPGSDDTSRASPDAKPRLSSAGIQLEDAQRRKSTKQFDSVMSAASFRAVTDGKPSMEKYIAHLTARFAGLNGLQSGQPDLQSTATDSLGPDESMSTPRSCTSPALSELDEADDKLLVDDASPWSPEAIAFTESQPPLPSVTNIHPGELAAGTVRGSTVCVEGFGDISLGIPIDQVRLHQQTDFEIDGRRSPKKQSDLRRKAPQVSTGQQQSENAQHVRQLMKFPDAAETASLIRQLETQGETRDIALSFGRNRPSEEDMPISLIPKRLPDVEAMSERFTAMCGVRYQHALIPREIEWDAGPNLLDQALAERVPVDQLDQRTSASKRRSTFDGDADDASSSDSEDSKVVNVFVGSRQFGFTPKPLRKAEPSDRDAAYWKAEEEKRVAESVFKDFLAISLSANGPFGSEPGSEEATTTGLEEVAFAPKAPARLSTSRPVSSRMSVVKAKTKSIS